VFGSGDVATERLSRDVLGYGATLRASQARALKPHGPVDETLEDHWRRQRAEGVRTRRARVSRACVTVRAAPIEDLAARKGLRTRELRCHQQRGHDDARETRVRTARLHGLDGPS
jgi:hypothetical protein